MTDVQVLRQIAEKNCHPQAAVHAGKSLSGLSLFFSEDSFAEVNDINPLTDRGPPFPPITVTLMPPLC